MTESKIKNAGLKEYICTDTPNQYGAIAFPSDLEVLSSRIAGINYCNQSTVLVQINYESGGHFFSCWDVRANSAYTAPITIGVSYI